MDIIHLGLPKGSLNTEERGNTHQLFLDAGYEIEGYCPGKESQRKMKINDDEIELHLFRPQNMPEALDNRFLDAAIIGHDHVVDANYQSVERICDLGYGKVRIVFAVHIDYPADNLTQFFLMHNNVKGPLHIYTEYVHITRRAIMENEGYHTVFGEKSPLITMNRLSDGENDDIRICFSHGATELFIGRGADLIVEATQTGRALKENNLKEIGTVLESSAGLYVGPSCIGWKRNKAEEIASRLHEANPCV